MKSTKKLLLELICNEQIRMIENDSNKYKSHKYQQLEELKVILNDLDISESRISAMKMKNFQSHNVPSSKKYKKALDIATTHGIQMTK